jgi:hypothetical protein
MNPIERWSAYRPTKEHLLWTAVAAAIATVAIGFGAGGWVTGGSAQKMADQAAEASHDQLAAAVCAREFMRASDARARLANLQKLQVWEREQQLVKDGWATMPGEREADRDAAELCVTRLIDQGKI